MICLSHKSFQVIKFVCETFKTIFLKYFFVAFLITITDLVCVFVVLPWRLIDLNSYFTQFNFIISQNNLTTAIAQKKHKTRTNIEIICNQSHKSSDLFHEMAGV